MRISRQKDRHGFIYCGTDFEDGWNMSMFSSSRPLRHVVDGMGGLLLHTAGDYLAKYKDSWRRYVVRIDPAARYW